MVIDQIESVYEAELESLIATSRVLQVSITKAPTRSAVDALRGEAIIIEDKISNLNFDPRFKELTPDDRLAIRKAIFIRLNSAD